MEAHGLTPRLSDALQTGRYSGRNVPCVAGAPGPVPEVTHTLETGQDQARARMLIRVSGMTKSWSWFPGKGQQSGRQCP